MEAERVIEVRGLRKAFGEEAVLKGIDLEVSRGAVTSLLGKSGAGKSVLLKCISGLVRPDAGEIVVNGKAVGRGGRIPPKLSYMFQNNALLDGMSAFDNVALPLREKTRMREREIRLKVKRLFQRLDLEDVDDKYPSQLSGGMLKRVALARSLALDPEIILFDEPTTGLDPLRKVSVLNMIERYQRQFGFTAVLVSHDLPDALFISDEIAILDAGRIAYRGSPLGLGRAEPALRATFLPSIEGLRNEVAGLAPCPPEKAAGAAYRFRFEGLGRRRAGESSALPDLRAARVIRSIRRALGADARLSAADDWAVWAHFPRGRECADPDKVLASLRKDWSAPSTPAAELPTLIVEVFDGEGEPLSPKATQTLPLFFSEDS